MSKRTIGLWLGCLVVCSGLASGEEQPKEAAEKSELPKVGSLSLTLNVDVVTDYYFRGYLNEGNGFIIQPGVKLGMVAYSSEALTITPYIAGWESFHSTHTGADHNPRVWYEADYTAGVDFAIGDFTAGLIYNVYTSPSGAFGTVQELGISLEYDDSALMEKLKLPFTLTPRVSWFWELSDDGGTEDQYLEFSIEPAFTLVEKKLDLSFPVTAGFSTDSFYLNRDGHNAFCGYVSSGAMLRYQIPMPEKYGTWSIKAGVLYYTLMADSAKDSNHGHSSDWVGVIGLEIGL